MRLAEVGQEKRQSNGGGLAALTVPETITSTHPAALTHSYPNPFLEG
jgi:hypothetical protein